MATQFYAYLWLRENGLPWYVGKGSGNRAYQRHKNHWAPKDQSLVLVLNRDSEQEAFDTEIELIRNWGRKDIGAGCLHNRTDGGDGHAGYVPTVEHRDKVRRKSQGNQNMLGHVHTVDAREKMAQAKRGVKKSLEARANMSKAKLGKSLAPHVHEAARLANIGRAPSSESIQKMAWARKMYHEQKFLATVAWG